MKEHIREYKSFKIYLTPEDASYQEGIYSYTARVFDGMNDCIYSHYFSMDDVYYGGYSIDYMFKRMYSGVDLILEDWL